MTLIEASPYIGVGILILLMALWSLLDQQEKHRWILWWREFKRKLKG